MHQIFSIDVLLAPKTFKEEWYAVILKFQKYITAKILDLYITALF